MKSKIWIDNDGGIDDTLALIMALNSPDLEILGISTVAGNVNVKKATKNVLNFLEIHKRTEIPLYRDRRPGSMAPGRRGKSRFPRVRESHTNRAKCGIA